jgi:hypothetical protein
MRQVDETVGREESRAVTPWRIGEQAARDANEVRGESGGKLDLVRNRRTKASGGPAGCLMRPRALDAHRRTFRRVNAEPATE